MQRSRSMAKRTWAKTEFGCEARLVRSSRVFKPVCINHYLILNCGDCGMSSKQWYCDDMRDLLKGIHRSLQYSSLSAIVLDFIPC